MKLTYASALAAAALLAACAEPTSAPTSVLAPDGTSASVSTNDLNGAQLAGAPEHFFFARGENAIHADLAKPSGGGGGSSPLMTYHSGIVLVTNKTQAIFWGSWGSPGDKITGLDAFFNGFGGSNYAGLSTEYYGTGFVHVTTSSTYLGHALDASAPPRNALSVSNAVAEACKITGNHPDPAALYLIYTSTGAGHVSYCAWHSYGNCGGTNAPVQVAYMPNIDGIAGCSPQDTNNGHSAGLAALANVTAHELSETITDPRGGGWYDSKGAENGDKCAWTFSGNVTLGSTTWKLQQEWSNNAYTASSGNPRGCLQGN
jgi:hypothetical protein